MRSAALLLVAAAAGCANDLDPQWQLSHERIIGVRATPPHLAAPGDQSTIDALLGHKDAPTEERSPDGVQVVSPASLAGAVSRSGGKWIVTAPSDAQLAAARTELGLAADAPVPLQLGVGFADTMLAATKIVVLGDSGDNPPLAGLTIDGKAPGPGPLVVAPLTDIRLEVTADDATENVNWLTSCGTMHDFDLAKAYLRVETADPQTGELGVILRDGKGGVAWQLWPISAQ